MDAKNFRCWWILLPVVGPVSCCAYITAWPAHLMDKLPSSLLECLRMPIAPDIDRRAALSVMTGLSLRRLGKGPSVIE
jgi:hypothetical protein